MLNRKISPRLYMAGLHHDIHLLIIFTTLPVGLLRLLAWDLLYHLEEWAQVMLLWNSRIYAVLD